jgi:hypothetical protein
VNDLSKMLIPALAADDFIANDDGTEVRHPIM